MNNQGNMNREELDQKSNSFFVFIDIFYNECYIYIKIKSTKNESFIIFE